MFHAEGPLVVGITLGGKGGSHTVMHIGMPENMITWALTPDLPTLKVQKTAFMAAVPYSQRFYIIDFLPETPEAILAAFEKVLAECTSFAVADAAPMAGAPTAATPPSAAPPALEQTEKVSAASGQTFTTTPATASKIRSAGEAIAGSLHLVGEHVGAGIVYAGEWYRKRVGGTRTDVKMSEATLARIDGAKKTTGKVASLTTTVASRVGAAVGSVAYGAKETAKKAGIGKQGSVTHGVATTMKDSVCALVEVFDAMHDAGRRVVTTGAEETATCVQYRYGDEAGGAARQGMGIAVDAYDVYGAYKAMRTRALAKAFITGSVTPQGAADGSGSVAGAGVGAPVDGGKGEGSVGGGPAPPGGIQMKKTVERAAAEEDTGSVQLVEPLLH